MPGAGRSLTALGQGTRCERAGRLKVHVTGGTQRYSRGPGSGSAVAEPCPKQPTEDGRCGVGANNCRGRNPAFAVRDGED